MVLLRNLKRGKHGQYSGENGTKVVDLEKGKGKGIDGNCFWGGIDLVT